MGSIGEDLRARYREIDGLMSGSHRVAEVRRWQAATGELLRRGLGFHVVVVQFQGLRFFDGSVDGGTASSEDPRLQANLGEAKGLVRQALEHLHVDVAAVVATADPLIAAVQGATWGDAAGRARALEAAVRLNGHLAEPMPNWESLVSDLQVLLAGGLVVARVALKAVARRLVDIR